MSDKEKDKTNDEIHNTDEPKPQPQEDGVTEGPGDPSPEPGGGVTEGPGKDDGDDQGGD